MNWLQALERAARQHHDLKAGAQMHNGMGGSILAPSGDLRGALSENEQGHALYEKTGDFKLGATCLAHMGHAFLSLGDLRAAEEHLSRALEIQERVGVRRFTVRSLLGLGTVALCQGRAQRGAEAFQKVIHLEREIGGRGSEARATHGLGRAYLAQGEREAALRAFRAAITLAREDPSLVALALSGADQASANAPEFRAFCHRIREELPEFSEAPFRHWFLEPAEPNFGFWILDFGLPTSGYEIQGRTAQASEYEIQAPSAQTTPKIQNPKSKIGSGSGRTPSGTARSRYRTGWRSTPPMDGTSGTST
jgi:tetratricopeptide (TPR) repeat protein